MTHISLYCNKRKLPVHAYLPTYHPSICMYAHLIQNMTGGQGRDNAMASLIKHPIPRNHQWTRGFPLVTIAGNIRGGGYRSTQVAISAWIW